MIKKYNLALLPREKNNDFINLISLFETRFGTYKLGSDSLPHITILQFYIESNRIDEIWEVFCKQLGDIEITLTFKKISYVTFDEKNFWVSIVPNNSHCLFKMNKKALSILNLIPKKEYDPHMTLFSTKDPLCKFVHKDLVIPFISDKFYLAIGNCDEVGQFTDVIRSRFT